MITPRDVPWLKQPPLWVGSIPLLLFLLIAAVDLELARTFTSNGKTIISQHIGGLWQWLVLAVFLVAMGLAISPIGSVKLGGAGAKPTIRFFDWCAVLICTLLAGGGVFWSAAEPLFHFQSPAPYFPQITGGSSEAVDPALAVSFLHWGFLAWALVATTVTITFSMLEKRGEPLRPRSLLVGVLPRDWVDGAVGDFADGLSVVAAVAGTVGPLGFLSLQLSNAAGQLPWLSDSAGLQSLVVILLTAVFATSTVSGIQRGIKWLSELNVVLTLGLAAAILLVGPGLWLLQHFLSAMLLYINELPAMALASNNAEQAGWLNGWTIFYWGWFLGYAPLMGLFTAGVSRGRSMRELVLAVAILCPLVTNLWFTLLGGTGIALELADAGSISGPLQMSGAAAALLAILSQLPLAWLLIPTGLLLVVLFMATSADSMSYAAAMVVSGEREPAPLLRLFWALMIGSLTLVLLRIGTSLGDSTSIDALQAFIVIAAVPVTPLVLLSLWSAPRLAWREWASTSRATARP
ncbi:BCCT family transporter [Synechococcus sp. W4D4]|uniref:BCCT family transporter n=1 Tax=Synechococcus sp. W4D4 TaxID=3392294 RepID=UPI0039EC3589